jgi:hypothetical protein
MEWWIVRKNFIKIFSLKIEKIFFVLMED